MAVKPIEHAGVVLLPQVRDPETGRIDAGKLARALGVKKAQLARTLGVDRRLLSSKPTLPKIQKRAAILERALAILIDYLGDEKTARMWFHTPHPSLEGHTAWEVCENREAFPKGLEVVLRMVERVPEGIPS